MTTRLLVPRRGERRNAASASRPLNEYFEPTTTAMAPERRTSQRFPIELQAEVYIGQKSIMGTTVNISSGGLLISCSPDELKPRRRVTVRLTNWPRAPQRGKIALVLTGSVVRIGDGCVAVQRISYEFVED